MNTQATNPSDQKVSVGCRYVVEHVRNGKVIDTFDFHNLVPTEGLNHITGVVIKGVAQVSSWFIGLFEGNYTPVPGDTAALFPTASTECTAYVPSTRPAFTAGAVAAGTADNTASRAEFTFTAAKTVYGAFVSPASAKSGTTGPLLSAARFPVAKGMEIDDILRVTCSFVATSVS